jgi:glyoxylase I family protein
VVLESDWAPATELGDQIDKIIGIKGTVAKVVMVELGGVNVEIFEYSSPTPKPKDPEWRVCDHGYTHICLEVDDIDAEYDRLSNAGMTFHGPPPPFYKGLRALYGRDPDGNVVEILQIDADAS